MLTRSPTLRGSAPKCAGYLVVPAQAPCLSDNQRNICHHVGFLRTELRYLSGKLRLIDHVTAAARELVGWAINQSESSETERAVALIWPPREKRTERRAVQGEAEPGAGEREAPWRMQNSGWGTTLPGLGLILRGRSNEPHTEVSTCHQFSFYPY